MNDPFASSIVSPAPRSSGALVLQPPRPVPRCEVSVRDAVADDLGFIDQLQKMHSHMVGFLRYAEIEKKIEAGHVVIALDSAKKPIGYCIAQDQYLKRDDVGIVYQLNVLPLKQRSLIGATLVKAVFDRAAYGCKLFCCWCAQDIQANWFWESIGFVPLAFRTGSRAKQRIHIFWQKRIREGDTGPGATPYWYPAKTEGGAVGEDRLVLPIPSDTHWRDAKPLVLPGLPAESSAPPEMPKSLPGGALVKPRPEQQKITKAHAAAIARSKSKHLNGCPGGKAAVITAGGVKYVDRADAPTEELVEAAKKPKRVSKPRQKHDPKYVKAARDLRDQYLEEINTGRMLPSGCDERGMMAQKYEVSRILEAGNVVQARRLIA